MDTRVVELVDTQDLKSCLQQCKCGFNSHPEYSTNNISLDSSSFQGFFVFGWAEEEPVNACAFACIPFRFTARPMLFQANINPLKHHTILYLVASLINVAVLLASNFMSKFFRCDSTVCKLMNSCAAIC